MKKFKPDMTLTSGAGSGKTAHLVGLKPYRAARHGADPKELKPHRAWFAKAKDFEGTPYRGVRLKDTPFYKMLPIDQPPSRNDSKPIPPST